jgi:hypothetical protein
MKTITFHQPLRMLCAHIIFAFSMLCPALAKTATVEALTFGGGKRLLHSLGYVGVTGALSFVGGNVTAIGASLIAFICCPGLFFHAPIATGMTCLGATYVGMEYVWHKAWNETRKGNNWTKSSAEAGFHTLARLLVTAGPAIPILGCLALGRLATSSSRY